MLQSLQSRSICGFGARGARIQHFRGLCSEKLARSSRNRAGEWLGHRVTSILSWLHKETGVDGRRRCMLSLLASHCRFVTDQRLRRAYRIGELYSNLYAEHTRWSLVGSFWRRFQGRNSSTVKLVAALAGVFMWEDEKIRDEEMKKSAEELQVMEVMKNQTISSGQKDSCWEMVMEKKNFRVWRRPIRDSHLYEYTVLGTYTDITPRQFFNVQLDTEYRKKWDSLVIRLEVVDRDSSTGSEVLHWATHFPYPMYSRDYVYVRRYDVDVEKNLMVLVSRAVEHPLVPETKEFVRVHSYQSRMVIRPHRSFDENGFDYLLTYSDDPQTVFPRYCVSWMVSSGMPDFLEKLHAAALRAQNLEEGMRDYMSMVKPAQEFRGGDAGHGGATSRMEYA